MSEITDHLSGYLNELDHYMDRLNRNGLSKKDRQRFFEMSNEYYDIFQKAITDSGNGMNAFPEDLLKEIEFFSDNIIDPTGNARIANQHYEILTSYSTDYMEAVEHTELLIKIFQNDAEVIRLQNEKIEMMQRLTDIEMQRDGQISPETLEILDLQHSEVLNGRVREIGEWERQDSVSEKQEETAVTEEQDETEEKGSALVDGKRNIDKDELDQLLNDHFKEISSGSKKMLDLSNCIISNYVFKGNLDSISFDHSELRYCEFRETRSDHISMQNASLTNCAFHRAEFDHSHFKSAEINNARILGSMFREGTFDDAIFKQGTIQDSVFYKTSFQETHIRECSGGENVFHECGNPENTIKVEHAKSMPKDKFAKYRDDMKEIFSGDGYSYSWELGTVDLKQQTAELAVKVLRDGETVEEEKYSAILDSDTYEIVHIDTGRHDDPVVEMFTPEIADAIKKVIQEQSKEKEDVPVILKLPYMTKDTFLKVKEEIKGMGAKFNPRGKTWYVDQSIGQDMIDKINNYLSEHDEAIYLKLPSVQPQEFKQMISQIKQDGAYYNAGKKQWYITETTDRNKFKAYLPTKNSVHGKLNQYRSDAAKKQPDNQVPGYQRRETLERV